MKIPIRLTALGAALIVLTVGAAPLLSSAADHIDASAFGSLGTPGGAFDPMSVHGERDINDVYAFQGSNASRTVLAMTTNPAINAFGGKFGPNVRYIINVDRDGNAVQDLAYVVRFDDGAAGHQKYTVTRYSGANAVSLRIGNMRGSGSTAGNGTASLRGDGKVFAGVRSGSVFFFDLTASSGRCSTSTTTRSATTRPTSSGFNTNAIVIEVPRRPARRQDRRLGPDPVVGTGSAWMLRRSDGPAGHQHGSSTPLVDANAATTKNLFNQTPPSQQRTADGGQFRTNVITALTHINAALGIAHPDHTLAQAQGLADFLLPDVLTYDTATKAGGLNGRALSDDVIDIELGITTNGAVTSDGVGPHSDYLAVFPYLGVPHP
jgi:hypothetical protein